MYASLIQEKKTPWGGVVFITPYPAKDIISLRGSIAGGYRYMGEEYAKMHAAMLMEGTRLHSKHDIQIQLDAIGASLYFYSTSNRLCFSGRCRPVHISKLLALIGEILLEASFPAPELEVLKKREEAVLLSDEQDTRHQAQLALARTLFKPGHPNFPQSTREARAALQHINRDALADFHQEIVSCASLICSVAGDLEPSKVMHAIEAAFAPLPQKKLKYGSFPPAGTEHSEASITISMPHKTSIDYYIGNTTGITSTSEAYPALLLGMQILGDARGFSGRLMNAVREKEGLTYGVYGYLSGFSRDIDGYVFIWGTFAPALLPRGKAAIKEQLEALLQDGATEAEVRRHAIMLEARSRVSLSTSEAFTRAAHDLAVEGRPMSYLDTFPQQILALTTAEVNEALRAYLIVERMVEVAAGPVEKKEVTT